jgi:hypothetical protein
MFFDSLEFWPFKELQNLQHEYIQLSWVIDLNGQTVQLAFNITDKRFCAKYTQIFVAKYIQKATQICSIGQSNGNKGSYTLHECGKKLGSLLEPLRRLVVQFHVVMAKVAKKCG